MGWVKKLYFEFLDELMIKNLEDVVYDDIKVMSSDFVVYDVGDYS